MTKLDRYLANKGVKTAALISETRLHDPHRKGYSRNHLYSIRRGTSEPTRRCMSVILASVRALTGDANVRIEDLFEFRDVRRKAS